jgi:membrane-associated phospholipid phosphatase
VCAFSIDVPLSRWLILGRGLRMIHRTLQIAEPYGDAAGVVLVLVSLYVLEPQRRRQLARLGVAGLGAGLIADIPKMSIGRVRPYMLDYDVVQNCSQTFTNWLPLWSEGSKNQSFPSAHTAVAFALAVALTRLYPRGRWLFPSIAFLVGLQRVETGAHYLSDALCGAALGLAIGTLCVRGTALARWFDRLEQSPQVGLSLTPTAETLRKAG